MPEGWEPRSRGRRPLVEASPLLNKAIALPGQWIKYTTYSLAECRSLKRQLTAVGCLVSIEDKNGDPALCVKWEAN